MGSFLSWWHRQSKRAQVAMGAAMVVTFFVLFTALLSLGGNDETNEANSSTPAQEQTSPETKQQRAAALAAQRAARVKAKARAAKIRKAKLRARKARAARRRAASAKAAAAKAAAAKAAAAKAAAAKAAAAKAAAAKAAQASTCDKNYSGCLDPNASDYDCAGGSGNGPEYTGPVEVLGYDEYDLDADGDGYGCEDS